MSSLNVHSISNPNTVPMPRSGRVWYVLKYMEGILVVTCLLMLILTQYLNIVVDDFTSVKTQVTTEPVKTTTSQTDKPTIQPKRANEVSKIVMISKESSEPSARIKLRDVQLESELMMNGDTHIRINRVKKVSDKEELKHRIHCKDEKISLSDLLIMFPCATTLLMVTAMEILGEIYKDPLSKLSNLILIFLAMILATTLSTVSLLAYLKTPHTTLVLTTALSALLVAVEIMNFILLVFS